MLGKLLMKIHFCFQLSETNDFKPLLCVDNSCLNCDTRTQVDGDTWRTVVRAEVI